jgi:hypothetical protein
MLNLVVGKQKDTLKARCPFDFLFVFLYGVHHQQIDRTGLYFNRLIVTKPRSGIFVELKNQRSLSEAKFAPLTCFLGNLGNNA